MNEYLLSFVKLGNNFTHTSVLSIVLSLTIIFLSVDTKAFAVGNGYQIEAYRTYQNIEIDGYLNEADWENAEPIDQFVQIEPYEGTQISELMEVRILYDEENIYFGFNCFDSEPSKLIANEMRRDARDIHENDNVFLLLDTYNDKRSGFFFRMNALGAVQDRAVTNSGDTFNSDWDAVVECNAKINDIGWTLEFSIPFSQLRFNKRAPMVWGINTGRELPRNQEESIWVPVPASYGGLAKYRTANLGTLSGLEGIAPSRTLEVLPYVLPGITQSTGDDSVLQTAREFKVGFDAKYGITSNLIADFTYNTDFAQVEADEEQVNLSRFSLFFPEKRPFFLEGAGLFDMGVPRSSFRRPPPLLLFYSRRIGLAEGSAIPIIVGGKATGKIGAYGVGILNVLTDEFYHETDDADLIDVPRTNYSVMRVTKDVSTGSRIGMIAVNKEDTRDYNRSGGVDFEYRPNDSLDVRGMWARTFEQQMSGKNNAAYVGSRWRNNNFRLAGSYTDIDDDFNPDVGYVRQRDIRRMHGEFRWAPRPQRYGVREMWAGPEVDYILNQQNELEEWNVSYVHWFSFSTGDSIMFSAKREFEKLDEDFEIRDGVIIPVGDYQFSGFSGRISTSDSRPLNTTTGFELGNFYNGSLRRFYVNVTLKPTGRMSLESFYQFNRVNLPDISFDANLFTSRFNYSFSTSLFAKLFAQWNQETNVISTNFLINYTYHPGSDFYLVFNQTYDTDKSAQTTLLDSTVVGKFTYWWNP